MTEKYHVNEEGKVGRCFAKKVCRFGTNSAHFYNKEHAIGHATSMLEEKYGTSVKMKLTSGENRKYSQKVKSSKDIKNISKTLDETVAKAENVIEKLSAYDTNIMSNQKTKFPLSRCNEYFEMAMDYYPGVEGADYRLTIANNLRDNLKVIVRETIKSNLKYCNDYVNDPNNTDADKEEEIKYHQENYNDIAESLLELGIKMKPLNIDKIVRDS